MSEATTFEAAASAVASKVMYTGGSLAGSGVVLSNELIGAIGLVLAFAGFVVNWYYRSKRDRREELEFLARIERQRFNPLPEGD